MMINVFDRVQKIVEKAENAGYQHYLTMFEIVQSTRLVKT